MGVVYRVEPGVEPDLVHDHLAAEFGWAHLHAFNRLLAAEEGIELSSMVGYGGSDPWDHVGTPLRPLFDPDAFEGSRLPAQECVTMCDRLSAIHAAWSSGAYAGTADSEMKSDQLVFLGNLTAVIGACIETGRALTVG